MPVLSWINKKDWITWKKKYSMTDDYMLINVLEKIKKMKGIDINDDTKILIGTDGKLPDGISLWLWY